MDQQEIIILIGKRIKALRLERGWTQEVLADKLNCDYTLIGRIENARSADIKLSTIRKLCNAFEISIEDFFKDIK